MKFIALLGISVTIGLLLSSGGSLGSPGVDSTANSAAHASLTVAGTATATAISPAFWGVNVLANYPFNATNASQLTRTPASYLLFPGGALGEEFNYTSGAIARGNGASYIASTSTAEFVASCQLIHCHAIMQLPAEIDRSGLAAYYASYVVNTLGFQPAYWQIGNTVPGWTHFGVPWAQWGTQSGGKINASVFAQLVHSYIPAIRAVDPDALFLALGAGMGKPGYDQYWVTNLTVVDGHNLSGISLHSYTMGAGPANPTWAELLANLNGNYSLPSQVSVDRGYISSACPTCNVSIFVTEANAAEVGNFTPLTSSFAGTLYVAADTAQGLNLELKNIDWFCFSCNYSGSWEGTSNAGNTQYTLFEDLMTRLGPEHLNSTLTGPTSLYAAVTYGPQGYALLVVNVNMTQTASINLFHSGLPLGGTADRERWSNGTKGPHASTITLGKFLSVPALTIEVITFP
jgi:hypothetical protein